MIVVDSLSIVASIVWIGSVSELQINKANTSFLQLHLFVTNNTVYTKIYNRSDDFDLEIVNFPFLNGAVPHFTSYGVYISQLI